MVPRPSSSAAPSVPMPEREAGCNEIAVETQNVSAFRRRHHREADGIRIGDWSRRKTIEPAASLIVVPGRREVHDRARARVDSVEHPQRRLEPRPEQREPVNLRHNQVRRNEPETAADALTKQTVRLGVMLISPAPQRDPGAAIDERRRVRYVARGSACHESSVDWIMNASCRRLRLPGGGSAPRSRCRLYSLDRSISRGKKR